MPDTPLEASTPCPEKWVGGGVTLVQVLPPSWVRATARAPPTVPSAQPSSEETKVTDATAKPAIGVHVGVAGETVAELVAELVAEADGMAAGALAQPDDSAAEQGVGVAPPCGLRVPDAPPQATASAATA
jgi:hypothetical protein